MKRGLAVALMMLALSSPVQADYMKALMRGDIKEGIEEMRPLAQKGNAKAQFDYALMFETGLGVIKDEAEAAQWYQKSAAQGYPYAQNNLAVMYQEGRGVKQDYAKASQWFAKAARQGLNKAQYSLGLLYAEGKGVNKDVVQAYMWLTLSASDKYVTDLAQEKCNSLRKTMTPDQLAQAQKLIAEFKPTKTNP